MHRCTYLCTSQDEYQRLVSNLQAQGAVPAGDEVLANPVLPQDILNEAVRGACASADWAFVDNMWTVSSAVECGRMGRRPSTTQVPGNIRRAEHFVAFMRRFVSYLRSRMRVTAVESESPATFLNHVQNTAYIDGARVYMCHNNQSHNQQARRFAFATTASAACSRRWR